MRLVDEPKSSYFKYLFLLFELSGKISYMQVNGKPCEEQRHVYLTSLPRLIYVNPQIRSEYLSVYATDHPLIYLHGMEDEKNINTFTVLLKEDNDAKIFHFYPRDMTLAKSWVELCVQSGLCQLYTEGTFSLS